MVEQAKEVAKEAQIARISALQAGEGCSCCVLWSMAANPFSEDRVQTLRIHSCQFVSFQTFAVKVLGFKLPDLQCL